MDLVPNSYHPCTFSSQLFNLLTTIWLDNKKKYTIHIVYKVILLRYNQLHDWTSTNWNKYMHLTNKNIILWVRVNKRYIWWSTLHIHKKIYNFILWKFYYSNLRLNKQILFTITYIFWIGNHVQHMCRKTSFHKRTNNSLPNSYLSI